ncbi:2-oxo acid dehydrogenase subunit E2 [Raineyella fluvialis]|nr:2-oxo acid dehydrogenase subunit E2 [Raineyella fluvialis]
MVLFRRADGIRVDDIPPLRRVVPFLTSTRIDSMVYYPQRVDVDHLLDWLADYNQGRPAAERITFFHVFLTALARTFHLRPELNRFISGRRTYVHKDISFSFVVKKAMTDEAPETQVQVSFTGRETVVEVRDRINAELARARGKEASGSDRLIDVFAAWPGPALAAVAWFAFFLDFHNLLPRFLREAIPLYASAYLVNLGSLGAEAPFHHLYQQGTASAFVAIGAIRKEAIVDDADRVVVRRCVNIVHTLDERATEGFYAVRSAQLLQGMLEVPEQLLEPLRE